MSTNKDVVTLFAGGGLKTLGAVQAGYTPVMAVEYDEAIASVYSDNIGAVRVAKVEDVDPRPYAGIDLLLASPVCTNASVANAARGEKGTDMSAAEGVCRWLREARPERFVMENVTQYREFDSCKSVLRTLTELGYWWSADNVNFADYSVPQTRRRLIVRAMRDAMLPSLPAPTPWIGWYAAIEDILHTLPESKFADWQLKRLPEDIVASLLVEGTGNWASKTIYRGPSDAVCRVTARDHQEPSPTLKAAGNGFRALLLDGQKSGAADAAGDRAATTRRGHEPCFTITSTTYPHRPARAFLMDGDGNRSRPPTVPSLHRHRGGDGIEHGRRPVQSPRAWLEQGRVVSLTPRALARLQTLPDTYRLPESRRLACQIIGNGFSTEAARRIIGGLS